MLIYSAATRKGILDLERMNRATNVIESNYADIVKGTYGNLKKMTNENSSFHIPNYGMR
jgi:hypothetical protein